MIYSSRHTLSLRDTLPISRGIEACRPHPLHQRLRLAFAPGLQSVAIDEVQRTQGQRRITFGETVGQGHAVAALESGGEAASSQSASAARVSKCRSGRMSSCGQRSEEHTSELQSLMRISYAVFCLKKKKQTNSKKRRNTDK